jgi:hypothetical protein
MTFDTAIAGSGILALSVTGRMAEGLFAGMPDKNLADAQKSLDSGNPHVSGFPLTGAKVRVHADVVRETRTGRNITAYLPATTSPAFRLSPRWSAGPALPKEWSRARPRGRETLPQPAEAASSPIAARSARSTTHSGPKASARLRVQKLPAAP